MYKREETSGIESRFCSARRTCRVTRITKPMISHATPFSHWGKEYFYYIPFSVNSFPYNFAKNRKFEINL
jgi:hypothetical protein